MDFNRNVQVARHRLRGLVAVTLLGNCLLSQGGDDAQKGRKGSREGILAQNRILARQALTPRVVHRGNPLRLGPRSMTRTDGWDRFAAA